MATPEPNDLVELTTKDAFTQSLTGMGLFLRYFGAYGILVINVVGLIGNLLTVYVFILKRKRTGPVAIYFVCLALSDAGNLVMGLQTWFHNGLFYITDGGINIPSGVSDVACKIRVYIWNVFVAMSGYVIAAFSAERVVAIYFPLKASTLITDSRRVVLLIGVTVFSFTTPLPYFVSKYQTSFVLNGMTRYTCGGNMDVGYVLAYLNFIQQFHLVVPLILILVLNLAIIVGIKRATETELTKSKTKVIDKKIVLNLLVIAFIYLLTIGAYAIFRLIEISYNSGLLILSKEGAFLLTEWSTLASNFIVLNYASNFIIYSLSLDFYREAIKNLLCGCFIRKDKSDVSKAMESNMTASSTASSM